MAETSTEIIESAIGATLVPDMEVNRETGPLDTTLPEY